MILVTLIFVQTKKVQTEKMACAIYEQSMFIWFAWFKIKHFGLENEECSRRPAVIDDCQIQMLIKNNPSHITQDITEMIHRSHSVVMYLKRLGYVNHYHVWMSHDLTEKN